MKNTAGEAKRRGRKAPMSVPFFLESKAKDWQYKKGDRSLPKITAKRSEEKRDRPHHWVQCVNSLPGDKAQLHGPWQLPMGQGARQGS